LTSTKKEAIGKSKVFSKAIIFGDLIFLSGIGPHDPETGKPVEGGVQVSKLPRPGENVLIEIDAIACKSKSE